MKDSDGADVVVAGDLIIDWFLVPTPPTPGDRRSRVLQQAVEIQARAGGATLLGQLVEAAVGSATVAMQRLSEPPAQVSREAAVHSIIELDRFPVSRNRRDAGQSTYRAKRFLGFSVPAGGTGRCVPVVGDSPEAKLVLLYDAGYGFRSDAQAWPAALTAADRKPIVLLKMGHPLATGDLWELLRKRHGDRLVVVIDADDLRADGVNISRKLSWERSAKDLVWQLACNSKLTSLANCGNLLVRFGTDGVVHYARRGGRNDMTLHYDPATAEDDYAVAHPGLMSAVGSAFVAGLAARLLAGGLNTLPEAIPSGVRASRRLIRQGYGRSADSLGVATAALFLPADAGDPSIASVAIPPPTVPEPADPTFWCILKDVTSRNLEGIAFETVGKGSAPGMKSVPTARFRHLLTVDRAEIESYRTIRNLMLEYLSTPKAKRPLSIAVFGPPGSGKSFGVTEVAEDLAPDLVKRIEFNLSQFDSPADLVAAMHKVRDLALTGVVPLVFFDEFDSAFEGRLGWLKYFLAPMQDGAFKDGETTHPIGRAIFVFAGGTSSNYREFSQDGVAGEVTEAMHAFRAAKGTDFVSRLRGYVDVMGPNAVGPNDHFFIIRRAMLLRSLIERKAPHLIDVAGRLHIDDGVLRAMLKIPVYKHGVRSMEAVLDMSQLAGRSSFEQAALPPKSQISLHVDGDLFARLVVRDVLLGGARELIARAIHESFRLNQKDRDPTDPSIQPWELLREDLKESNRLQADDIPEKLRRITCGFTPVVGRDPVLIEFTTEEIEIMAEAEHDRWNAEKRLTGWTLGDPKNNDLRITPYLVEWKDLPNDIRRWDRDAVKCIPELLARAKFEIYRMSDAT